MSTRRSSLLGAAVVLAAVLAGGVLWVIATDAEDGGDGAVVAPAERGGPRGAALADEPAPAAPARVAARTDAVGERSDEDALADEVDAPEPLVEVSGRVLRADGGPLPTGLTVSARRRPPWPRRVGFSDAEIGAALSRQPRQDDEALRARTEVEVARDGRFTMPGVPASGAWLAVHDDFLYPVEPVRLRDGEGPVEAELTPGALLEVDVANPDGSPAAGARVHLSAPFDPMMVFRTDRRVLARTDREADDEGRCTIAQVPADEPLVLGIASDEHVNASTDVPPLRPGDRRAFALAFGVGGTIAGHAFNDAGEPLAAVTVHLEATTIGIMEVQNVERDRREGETDEDGAFRFEGLAPGEYEVIVSAAGYRPQRSGAIELEPGGEVLDVRVVTSAGLSVSGIVTDADGAPIEGARVDAFLPPQMLKVSSFFDRIYRPSVRTGADGRFVAGGFDEGPVQVEVRAADYAGDDREVRAGDTDVRFALDRIGTLSGFVVSKVDGEPVSEFGVRLKPSGGLFDFTDPMAMGESMRHVKQRREVEDDEGRFEIDGVAAGTYDLTVDADGFGERVIEGIEVERGRDRPGVVVMLDREAVVTGTVVSARTGEPVEHASVATGRTNIVSQVTEMMTGSGPSATTDAQGRFALRGLSDGPLKLTVTHDRFLQRAIPEFHLTPGEQRDLGTIPLSSGAAVFGTVYDADGGRQAHANVFVSDATGGTMRTQRADDAGDYRVEGLPAGGYQVVVMDFGASVSTRSDDYTEMFGDMIVEMVELAADEEKRVDLRAKDGGGATVVGTVRSADGPESGAMVTLTKARGGGGMPHFASTDDGGRFEIEDVAEGEYLLQVIVSTEEAFTSGSPAVSPIFESVRVIGTGTVQHDVRVPGGVLRGVVVDADTGEHVGGVRVLLERHDAGRPDAPSLRLMGWRVAESYSAEDGSFRFRHLPEGRYAIVAGGANTLGIGNVEYGRSRVDDLEVSPRSARFEVRVELTRGGVIAGEITDAGGNPLSGVNVWSRDEDGEWSARLSETASDASGRYELPGLRPGRWTLAFRGAGHALTVVEDVLVRRGETARRDVVLRRGPEVVLEIPATGVDVDDVEVAIDTPWGIVPGDLRGLSDVMAFFGAEASGGATVRLGRWPPGTYEARAWTSEATLGARTFVVPDAAGPVSFTLEPISDG